MQVDLHIHSTASDGCWAPEEIVDQVVAKGIGLFALTDHDTTANLEKTALLAKQHGLHFLRGTEISTWADGVLLHILGYNIDPLHPELSTLLESNHLKGLRIDEQGVLALIEQGVAIDLIDYQSYSFDRSRGGFKSYNYMRDRGFCEGINEWFETFGSRIKHDWSVFPHPQEACRLIRAAGGVPIVAHPGGSLARHGGLTDATLGPLLDYGIAGLEVYSFYHTQAMTAFCLEWCLKRKLHITGGSDYHGPWLERKLGTPHIGLSDLVLYGLESAALLSKL